MKLSKMLLRERTNLAQIGTTSFNAPGNYKPPYGKGTFKVGGRGASGNPSTGGNFANTNASTPGNVSYYNPTSPGNYAYTNPDTGDNFAGNNPTVPGNFAGYNPPIPGNSGTNPPDNNGISLYEYQTGPNVPGFSYSTYTVNPYFAVGPFSSYNPTNNSYYSVVVGYGVTIPGNHYANSSVPGNSYFNPTSPGSAYYNPIVPGNDVFNPTTPGNAVFNPTVPGNANYNPYVVGNNGSPTNIFGVAFPGGVADSLAPVVSPLPATIAYNANGTPITVSPGGYVNITAS